MPPILKEVIKDVFVYKSTALCASEWCICGKKRREGKEEGKGGPEEKKKNWANGGDAVWRCGYKP
jgi:hypothetical protein